MARLQSLRPQVASLPSRLKSTAALGTTNPESWRVGKTTAERGYGGRWQRARATFLQRPENVCCRMCAAEGIVTLATVVDHIVPHRGNQDLFWDTSNWQALCKTHHDSHKQREDRGGGAKPHSVQSS